MPFPVLAGIPWIASLLGSFFTALFTWLAQYLTKRFAIVAAAVVVVISLTVALFSALQALVTGLGLVLPPEVLQGAALFLPSNTDTCITAMMTARTARYAYDWNIKIIQYKLF